MVRLLLKGRERSLGELKQVWGWETCGSSSCSSERQSERWLWLLSISGKSVVESLGVVLMVLIILSGRVGEVKIQAVFLMSPFTKCHSEQMLTVCGPLSTILLAAPPLL